MTTVNTTTVKIRIAEIKEVISNLTINPISAVFFGLGVLALWMATTDNPEYNKTAVVVIAAMVLLRTPFPWELKRDE